MRDKDGKLNKLGTRLESMFGSEQTVKNIQSLAKNYKNYGIMSFATIGSACVVGTKYVHHAYIKTKPKTISLSNSFSNSLSTDLLKDLSVAKLPSQDLGGDYGSRSGSTKSTKSISSDPTHSSYASGH